MQTYFYATFMDPTKVIYTMDRGKLWKIMRKFGCPERLTYMVRQHHDGMTPHVTGNETISKAFTVTSGVHQNCLLTTTPSILTFPTMLMDVYHGERPWIIKVCSNDSQYLNTGHLNAQTRLSTTTTYDLRLGGECTLNTPTESDMQRSMGLIASGCANLGLAINTDKAVVLHQS
ncbi:hypothetical protein SprV_0100203900 [Sparganum proliferum]